MFSHTQSSLFPVRHQYRRRTFEYWLHEHLWQVDIIPIRSRSIILTDNASVSIHNHGRPDVNLHDLRDTHQRNIYANISVAALGFPIVVVRVLATGSWGRLGR